MTMANIHAGVREAQSSCQPLCEFDIEALEWRSIPTMEGARLYFTKHPAYGETKGTDVDRRHDIWKRHGGASRTSWEWGSR